MTSDPPEYQPDEDELTEDQAEDIGALFAAAAYEMTTWEWIWEQEEEARRDG